MIPVKESVDDEENLGDACDQKTNVMTSGFLFKSRNDCPNE